MVESRFDQNLNTNNVNTLDQESYRDEFSRTVKAVKQEGALGYLAFNSLVQDVMGSITYDCVRSYINGDKEVLEFTDGGVVVREVELLYGTDTWQIKRFIGSLLQQNGDFLLQQNGDQILVNN